MLISDDKLKELLVAPGLVSAADFKVAAVEAGEQKRDLAEVLVEKNLVKDEELGQLMAGEIGVDFINLRQEKIDESVLSVVPEIVARK
ncbi:MAG: hypothetical protein NTW06_00860, partial [Candidatus Falkowbacteria bacterium]|nr:hypothetical protein [Candidatus Falkowbacteria bacterium]